MISEAASLTEMWMVRMFVAVALVWVTVSPSTPAADDVDSVFYRDIQPVLVKACIVCHGPSKQESGYRIDLFDVLVRGGESGQRAVVPGDLAASHLWQRIASNDPDQQMPPVLY